MVPDASPLHLPVPIEIDMFSHGESIVGQVTLTCLDKRCPNEAYCALHNDNERADQGYVPELQYIHSQWLCSRQLTPQKGEVVIQRMTLTVKET